MLYAVAALAGMLAGIAAGGNISSLPAIRIEKKWLILAAFILQVLAQILGVNGVKWVNQYSFAIQAAVYCLLLAALWFNRHYTGIWMIGAGTALNVLVMMLNGGRMPVDESLLVSTAADPVFVEKMMNDGKHVAKGVATRLPFLGDVIPMPGMLAYGTQIVSIGDIITAVGLFIIVLEVMKKKAGKKETSGGQ